MFIIYFISRKFKQVIKHWPYKDAKLLHILESNVFIGRKNKQMSERGCAVLKWTDIYIFKKFSFVSFLEKTQSMVSDVLKLVCVKWDLKKFIF